MSANDTLAVLGGGNMGEAILRGLPTDDNRPFKSLVLFEPNEERHRALRDIPYLEFTHTAADAVASADVVLLAVKPQVMGEVLEQIKDAVAAPPSPKLIVSIAAGITSGLIEGRLPGARVVRTMPNTPLMVGKGVVALSAGASASAADVQQAERLFPGAERLTVDESMMDAVTAMSGSGPAYFFAFVEALAAAGEAQGFDRPTAYRLAAGTFAGAAALLEQSPHDAAELRRRVTSPGGTTAAALASFEKSDLPKVVRDAVQAATDRGRELAKA